jgi:N-acetylglucosaminyl-diphospho-decaprenol L-rhamnosyltransferase
MELSIICVNWNSVPYLRECIGSVYEHTRGLSFEVIVVDNASPHRDVDTLKEQFPGITIVKNNENLGFARANNLGFKHSSGKCVLFLNPDTRLITPAISLMLDHLRTLPEAGIVGGKLLNSDMSVQTESIQRFPSIFNQLLDVEYLRLKWPGCSLWRLAPLFGDATAPTKVEVIPGACQLLKRDVFEAAGLYSEDYFMYGEDIDLNYKVAALGLSSYYIGSAVLIHHGGTSSRQQKVSQWATKMKFRSMTALCRKWRGEMYSMGYRVAMVSAATGRLLILAMMLPFANDGVERDRVRGASAKWRTVLMCAVGFGGWA